MLLVVLEADLPHAHLVGQVLQYALAGLHAGGAVPAVGGQQQLHNELSVAAQPLGMGIDDHAVLGLFRAGGEALAPVVLHGTQAARAEGGELGMVAQGRHIDARLADNGQNVLLIGEFNFFAVDGNGSHGCPSLRFYIDGIKGTVLPTGAALDADGGIDMIGILDLAGDGIHRTVPGALAAALAEVRVDDEFPQGGTDLGAALLIDNVLDVLIPEGTQGGDNGQRGGFAQAAGSMPVRRR